MNTAALAPRTGQSETPSAILTAYPLGKAKMASYPLLHSPVFKSRLKSINNPELSNYVTLRLSHSFVICAILTLNSKPIQPAS